MIVPSARRLGIHFSEVAKNRKKLQKPLQELIGTLDLDLDESDFPDDLNVALVQKAAEDPSTFLSTIPDTHESLARRVYLAKVQVHPQIGKLCTEACLDVDDLDIPADLATADIDKVALRDVARLQGILCF